MVKVRLPKVKILVQFVVFLQLLGLGLVFFKQVLCEICTREIKTFKNMDILTINSAQLRTRAIDCPILKFKEQIDILE